MYKMSTLMRSIGDTYCTNQSLTESILQILLILSPFALVAALSCDAQ
jgi:hypothetical protein